MEESLSGAWTHHTITSWHYEGGIWFQLNHAFWISISAHNRVDFADVRKLQVGERVSIVLNPSAYVDIRPSNEATLRQLGIIRAFACTHLMASCQCEGIECLCDRREALRKLRDYGHHGTDPTTRLLLHTVRAPGIEVATLLDIGGGIVVAQLELLAAGAIRATDMDASAAYLDVAREEAWRRGYGDRVSYRHGDFVALAPEIELADIVTLDRVICCYHDMPALVRASAAKARRLYGLVFPRDEWWTRCYSAVENAAFRMRRHPYRSFIHPARLVDTLARGAGLEQRFLHQGAFWQVVLYARPAGRSETVCRNPPRSRRDGEEADHA